MRLTLRTLLAYLDDTLEPNEIKEIGQKVAESDAAQELVARIKQITRRRRLTTPPASGPGAKFDANTIAEYLDNELSSELVAELEKTCLESDVHLAEVASCHQILTLVLGEPALVPPTARERMYGLVKGREAIPFRKARTRDGAAEGAGGLDLESDDPLMPGMPASRGWVIWALPVAAVLVLAALGIAVWQSLPDNRPLVRVAANDKTTTPPSNVPGDPNKGTSTPPVDSPKDKDKPVDPPGGPDKPVDPPVGPDKPGDPPADTRPKPPSKVRAVVGTYVISPKGPSILVQRQADQPGWKRLASGSPVSSTDDLVSLPGYNSELSLGADQGAHLVLHGHVREFTVHPFEIMDFLAESAVKLHQPEAGIDLDLTLDRGRIYLSSHRADGPVKVRLRFASEVWDLTLRDPDTEIGVDLLQGYTSDINYRDGEAPLQEVYLNLLSGRAGIKIDYREYGNLPAPAVIHWDNKGKGASEPQPIARQAIPLVQAVWNKTPPAGATQPEKEAIALMREALDKLSLLMTEKKSPEAALLEARQAVDAPMTRMLAVYSFGAVDAVDKVLDVLCTDAAETHAADRNAAIYTLRRWISRAASNGAALYDAKKGTGLLMKYYKRSTDADTTLDMLHDFPAGDARKPATFEVLTNLLRHRELPIRELAYWHLLHLSAGVRTPAYNAGWESSDARENAAASWKALIGKELPPPATP